MKRLRFVVALTLAVGGLLVSRANGLAHGAAEGPLLQLSAASPPVLGLRPAVAVKPLPAMAWTAHQEAGQRVVASVPAGDVPHAVGPAGAGNDGAPTLVSTRRGLLLVAARTDDNGSRLWARRWESGSWRRAGRAPSAGRQNHHPAATAHSDGAWMVWVAGETATPRPGDPLYAARWDGRRWSDPEPLPSAPGEPMAPAITIDKRGRPVVVWAAGDGNDAEVWLSRRSDAARWSTPIALSDNEVPDIQPSIARTAAGRLLVAWSSYTPVGYEIHASGERGGAFVAPRTLSPAPATSPEVIEGGHGEVLWSRPRPGGGSRLQSATFDGRRARRIVDLADLYNGRFDVALGDDGKVLATWQSPTGPTPVVGSTDPAGRLRLQAQPAATVPPVSARATVPGGISIPGTWRGFGDSITLGLEVDENLLETPVDGYTVPLSGHLSSFTDRFIVVINSGVGGEDTAEALGRLAGLMGTDPKQYVLILSGANDIAVLVDTTTVVLNLTGMVRLVTAAGCLPLLGTLTPRRESAFIGGLNPRINEINTRLRAMAAVERALLVDLHSALFPHPELYSDLVHPNQLGYDALAVAWFRGIAPLLARIMEGEDTARDVDRARLLESRPRASRLDQ